MPQCAHVKQPCFYADYGPLWVVSCVTLKKHHICHILDIRWLKSWNGGKQHMKDTNQWHETIMMFPRGNDLYHCCTISTVGGAIYIKCTLRRKFQGLMKWLLTSFAHWDWCRNSVLYQAPIFTCLTSKKYLVTVFSRMASFWVTLALMDGCYQHWLQGCLQ